MFPFVSIRFAWDTEPLWVIGNQVFIPVWALHACGGGEGHGRLLAPLLVVSLKLLWGQSGQSERRTSCKVGRERTNLAGDSKNLKSEPRLEHLQQGCRQISLPVGRLQACLAPSCFRDNCCCFTSVFYGCTAGLCSILIPKPGIKPKAPSSGLLTGWTTRSFVPHFCFPDLTHPNPGSGREGNSEKRSCSLAELTVPNHRTVKNRFAYVVSLFQSILLRQDLQFADGEPNFQKWQFFS